MNTSKMIRLVMCALVLGGSVTSVDAAKKAKDARFVNPSKPEAKVRAVNRDPKPARPAKVGRSIPPNVHHVRPSSTSEVRNFKKLIQPGQAMRADKATPASKRVKQQVKRSHGSGYTPPVIRHRPHSKHNHGHSYTHSNRYHSHGSHSGLSLGLGLSSGHVSLGIHGHSGHGHHHHYHAPSYRSRVYSPYRYSHTRHYPYHHSHVGSRYHHWGWGAALCPPTTVIAASCYPYGFGSAYGYAGPAYTTTNYFVQADSSASDYRDWQQTVGAVEPVETLELSRTDPLLASGAAFVPSDRQTEALFKGWSLVAEGKSREAVTVFAVECELDPRFAAAKVGYAIASGLAGEGAAARWGMRRAMGLKTEGLAYLPAVEGLSEQLTRLSGMLWQETGGRPVTQDDWFLIASVEYLRHDLQSALRAAQEARDLGDTSPSLRNLMWQIEAEAGG